MNRVFASKRYSLNSYDELIAVFPLQDFKMYKGNETIMASERIRSVKVRDLEVLVERDEEPLGNKLILTGAYFCLSIDNVKANEIIRLGRYLQQEGLKFADDGDLPED